MFPQVRGYDACPVARPIALPLVALKLDRGAELTDEH
jgi:hypothetical protein